MDTFPKISSERMVNELEATESPVWEKYKPEFLAEGSERVVFSIPEHPNIVVKVSKFYLAEALNGGKIADADKKVSEFIRAEAEIASHFGRSHVLNGRYVLLKIPVLPFMSEYVSLGTELPDEVEVIAQVQKKLDLDSAEESYSLSGFFADDTDSDYAQSIVQGVFPTKVAVNVKETLRFKSDNTDMESIMNKIPPEATKQVADFIEKAIRFSKATGKNLDTMGPGNVMLKKEGGEWNYKLVDAMFAITESSWLDDVKQHIANFLQDPQSIEDEIDIIGPQVVLACSYVRFVNGFAQHLDLPERLDYFDGVIGEEDIEKLKEFFIKCRKAWRPYSRTANQAVASKL